MEDKKHTPLPYTMEAQTWDSGDSNLYKDTFYYQVVDAKKNLIARFLTKPKAEFIVRACNEYYQLKARIADLGNSHYELLTILEKVTKFQIAEVLAKTSGRHDEAAREWIAIKREAKAAIAKAGEKS